MESLADHALFNFSVQDGDLMDKIQTIQELLLAATGEDDYEQLVYEAIDIVEEYIQSTPHNKQTFSYLLASVQNLKDELSYYRVEVPSVVAIPITAKFDVSTAMTDDEQGSMSPSSGMDPIIAPEPQAIECSAQESMPIRCNVCWGEDSFINDAIVICDECEVAVHESCYSISRIPETAWYCNFCSAQQASTIVGLVGECAACNLQGGALVPSHNAQTWVHAACAIYIPELFFIHNKVEGVHRLKARRKLKCIFCKKSNRGACAQCSYGKCTTSYHVMCALENGITFHDTKQDGSYHSLCPSHRGQNLFKEPILPAIDDTPKVTQTLPETSETEPKSSESHQIRTDTLPSSTEVNPKSVDSTPKATESVEVQKSLQKWLSEAPNTLKPPAKPKAVTKKVQQHSTPPKAALITKHPMSITPVKGEKSTRFPQFRPQTQVFMPADKSDLILLVLPQLPLGIDLTGQPPYCVDNVTNPHLQSAFNQGIFKKGDELIALNNISLKGVTPTELSQDVIPNLVGPIQCWLRKAPTGPTDEAASLEWPWGYLRSDGKLAMVLVWQDLEELYFSCPKTMLTSVPQSGPECFEIPQVGTNVPSVVRNHRRALAKKFVETPLPPLEVGEMVQVAKRTWPGINKLGGTGRIKARHAVGEGFVYDVTYVLGGGEKGIERQYITPVTEDNPVSVKNESQDDEDEEKWTIHAAFVSPTGSLPPQNSNQEFNLKFHAAVEGEVDDTIEELSLPSNGPRAFKNFVVTGIEGEEFNGEDEILNEIFKCQDQLKNLDAHSKEVMDKLMVQVQAEQNNRFEKQINMMMAKQYGNMYKEMAALRAKEDASEDEDDDEEDDKLSPLFASIAEDKTQVCAMCLVSGGDLAVTSCGKKAHIMCLLYTPETYFENSMGYGLDSITPERSRLVCDQCKTSTGVNKIQCGYKKCTRALHVQCAYVAGLLTTHPFFGGWCSKHFKLTEAAIQNSVDLPPHMQKQRKETTEPAEVKSKSNEVKSTVPAKAPRHLLVLPPPSPEVVNEAPIEDFQVGDTVDVMPRMWSGINKPGGVGRIKKKHPDAKYDVEYILGSREKGVEAIYIRRYTDPDAPAAQSKRRRVN
ncbi:unnamed protein product [Aphanomyces euteiches]